MPSTANSLLSLIIVSLGFLGIILSFLVPERKNSRIAVFLSLIVVAVGGYEFVSQTVRQFLWQKKLDEIRKQQTVNLDQLRQRLRQGDSGTTATPGATGSPTQR